MAAALRQKEDDHQQREAELTGRLQALEGELDKRSKEYEAHLAQQRAEYDTTLAGMAQRLKSQEKGKVMGP